MTDITLAGLPFDAEFLAALPEFERMLAVHDYSVTDFSIYKARHPYVHYAGNAEIVRYDYTTQVHGESFLTTFSEDLQFLNYLAKLCLAPDRPQLDQSSAGIIPHVSPVEKISRIFHRAEHWLTDTPYKGK